MPALEEGRRAAKLAALQTRIVALSEQRGSNSEFLPWKTDVFYYLFAALASAMLPWLAGVAPVGLSSRGMVATGLCFALLCFAPALANQLRFWVGFSLPNRRFRRRIALVQAEMRRLRGAPK
jgi:hypothetical protein